MKRFLGLCLIPDTPTNLSDKLTSFKAEATRLSYRLVQNLGGYYGLTQRTNAAKLPLKYRPHSLPYCPVCYVVFPQQQNVDPFIQGLKGFMGRSLDLPLRGVSASGLEDIWDYYSVMTDGRRPYEAIHTQQRKIETLIHPNGELLALQDELCSLVKKTLGENALIMSPTGEDYRPSVLLWAEFHHANNKKFELPWDLLQEQSKSAPFRLVLGTIQPLGHMTAFTDNHVMVRQASTLVLT